MELKRFRAPSLRLALDQVKKELGPAALIVSTEKVREEGPLGLFGKDLIEVTATSDQASSPTPAPKAPAPAAAKAAAPAAVKAAAPAARKAPAPAAETYNPAGRAPVR